MIRRRHYLPRVCRGLLPGEKDLLMIRVVETDGARLLAMFEVPVPCTSSGMGLVVYNKSR